MILKKRINGFVRLGEFLNWFCDLDSDKKSDKKIKQADKIFLKWAELLRNQIRSAEEYNPWFTRENILYSLDKIGNMLDYNRLKEWTGSYEIDLSGKIPLNVGTVMAGNIPLVGFFDFLCVLISGNIFMAKMSSKDNKLLPVLKEILVDIDFDFEDRILFIDGFLKNMDAVIATGSNNTSRYFEYYFGKYPNIIRKNRSSVAVLTGEETNIELEDLGNDMLRYFGLGCRNVSKIYIPENSSPEKILEGIKPFSHIAIHNKYANNYDYNKSIFIMNNVKFIDNGLLLLKQDEGMFPPVSVVFYEYYSDLGNVMKNIQSHSQDIQCIVSKGGIIENSVEFGKSQQPGLFNYADNIDTMEFLSSLSDKNNG